jgi:hypothetical protein
VQFRSSPSAIHADDFSVADPRDIVDIDGLRRPQPPAPRASSADSQPQPIRSRPFLMIWFRCCATYGRISKTSDGLFYEGRCPKCLAHLEVPVGEGGTSRRMFEAS